MRTLFPLVMFCVSATGTPSGNSRFVFPSSGICGTVPMVTLSSPEPNTTTVTTAVSSLNTWSSPSSVRLTVRTLDGDDQVLSDDTAVVTVVELGSGDDKVTIGTVPQIPDEGNTNLEFPEGVPVADTQNMTNGNSVRMYVFGATQDDNFEVNHNVAELYLAGGDHDDTFVFNTFL